VATIQSQSVRQMAITSEELREYAEHGFIVGPQESEDDFLQRVELSRTAKQTQIPEKIQKRSRNLFGFSIDWVAIEMSSRLAWWHAGAMEYWEGRPRIQMSRMVWKWNFPVSREELLLHEWFHVARAGFDEPQFEELMAYRSSRGLRRWLSPLFQASWESITFLLLCLAGPLFVFSGWEYSLLPIGLFSCWLFSRLAIRHWLLDRFMRRITMVNPLHLALFLTDREILRFNEETVRASCRTAGSLRWRQIAARFPEFVNVPLKTD
jgi:hypothetical protein